MVIAVIEKECPRNAQCRTDIIRKREERLLERRKDNDSDKGETDVQQQEKNAE